MNIHKTAFGLILVSSLALAQCASGDKKEEATKEVEATKTKVPEKGTVAIEEVNKALKKITVEFPHDKDKPVKDLFPKDQLNKVTQLIRSAGIEPGGEYVIVVTGHASKIGTEKYNEGLAQRRAEYMVQWFVDGGVSRKIMKATNDGTKRNRRAVTFEIGKR